ncbi:hypothetical protein ACFPZL_06645 [Leucobacter soli]|uniref:hypothetical protein n=1 Tax=Leucobacter soli TaxID=2812850 RepID=UPI001C405C3C|nr:hypothetical protein [Leucobacter soli]
MTDPATAGDPARRAPSSRLIVRIGAILHRIVPSRPQNRTDLQNRTRETALPCAILQIGAFLQIGAILQTCVFLQIGAILQLTGAVRCRLDRRTANLYRLSVRAHVVQRVRARA